MPKLIESINVAMKKELRNTNITFSFNPQTHKVGVALAAKHCVGLYGQLAKMLGFGGDVKIRKSKESPYVPDLHDISSIFVYCNIVQSQIVGNTSVPLLRTIAVSGKSGDVITKTFDNIQCVPVQTKSFENIDIPLKTDTGNPLPFERGKVIATLYLEQQQGRGIPMFRGSSWKSSWKRGYEQTGNGLGGLFRSFGKIAKPMIKSGAKALGKIALASSVNLQGDVLYGKNPKQAAKACALEGANIAKMQAIQRAQRYAQTGRGQSKSTKRSRKRRAKKRKASPSVTKRKPTKNISSRQIWLTMNFVHDKPGECTKTKLDLFSVPPTQVSLEKGLWAGHQPVSSVSDAGPTTFVCPGTKDYMDLSKTILVVRAKVTKADGNNLDADERAGIVNNFLHSLFKQVDVFFKEKQVTQATGTYANRAYLETLLNYGPVAKQSQLTVALFYKGTPGKMDVASPTLAAPNANLGLKERYTFSHESSVLEMAGPLFCDMFRSERFLLSFADLKVILNRNINEFCLMASENDADYRVKLIINCYKNIILYFQ